MIGIVIGAGELAERIVASYDPAGRCKGGAAFGDVTALTDGIYRLAVLRKHAVGNLVLFR